MAPPDNYFLVELAGTKPEWVTPEKGSIQVLPTGHSPTDPIPLQWLSLLSF